MDGSFFVGKREQQVDLVAVVHLKRHEEMDIDRALALLDEIVEQDRWTHPLLVEEDTGTILDGHHRFWCACQLGLQRVPALLVRYNDAALEVSSWRADVEVTRELVMAAAASGVLMPKKTSKHIYTDGIKTCNISLIQLRRRNAA